MTKQFVDKMIQSKEDNQAYNCCAYSYSSSIQEMGEIILAVNLEYA